MRILSALTVAFLALAPGGVSGDDAPVAWEVVKVGSGEQRVGVFSVADAACAYNFMADTSLLERSLKHLERVDLHEDRGSWQDATYHERFFLVGLVQSRYHRTLKASERIEWKLVHGRQKRHDGIWAVTPTPEGATVRFDNVIEAKRRIHNGLLSRIQKRTMSDIATSAITVCGPA